MCLWFDSCFGGHVHQDYGHEPSTAKDAPAPAADAKARPPAWSGADHSQQRNGNQGQGYHGIGHKPSYLTAADEAGRKALHDARKDHAGAAATRDGHGYTAYAQDTAYTYSAADKARFYEPADMEDTTGYHYPTTTATISHAYLCV